MRLSFSNIAWDPSEDETVAALLAEHYVDAIDVAPGKYFPRPQEATAEQIAQVRTWWKDRGISITGMQALLFGTTGLNVFAAPAVQNALLEHLTHVFRIASGLGAIPLVFGSPRNRDRTGYEDDAAMAMAVEFFRRVGQRAHDHGVQVCLEPNPPRYGANFMTTAAETARVVRAVAHPAIGLQLDTGALTIGGESPLEAIERDADIIFHVHASEPGLVCLGRGGTQHAEVGEILSRLIPNRTVAIEMLPTPAEPHDVSMRDALKTACAAYVELRKP